MFTGIVETIAIVQELVSDGNNLNIKLISEISHELKVDQSLSHNGVCLTVTNKKDHAHWVTAVKETLMKSTLGELKVGDEVNLERAMKADGRFDGHIVQGHVDTVAKIDDLIEENGSWVFTFIYDSDNQLLVEKGSICVNGVSLTCYNISSNKFTVAIIPYTFHHTGFKNLKKGDVVNLEFDILGKYIQRLLNK